MIDFTTALYFRLFISSALTCVPLADCVLSEWSSWSECSASCGGGVSLRRKTILQQSEPGGEACSTPTEQHTACNTNSCLPGKKNVHTIILPNIHRCTQTHIHKHTDSHMCHYHHHHHHPSQVFLDFEQCSLASELFSNLFFFFFFKSQGCDGSRAYPSNLYNAGLHPRWNGNPAQG